MEILKVRLRFKRDKFNKNFKIIALFIAGAILYVCVFFASSDWRADVIDQIQIQSPGRSKRSPEYFPPNLHVNFKSKGEDVLLRLKRAEAVDVPVYLADNGHVKQTQLENNSISAIYHDITSGLPIHVKVSGTGEKFGQLYSLKYRKSHVGFDSHMSSKFTSAMI
ncbi:hypothetical protein LOTGIDRAFT_160890 [Lottia gigantea]|uniref:Uncharacterized protein n=1 Tax=Lottia gigantea TaxID=225164 RepID=V4AE28_LOTGI|nr:hypothetical protein LOTGIDRAFT_160890 [Lottia gigantea]ESO95127.1 hypothetical protein LOTGIDRAFT_160890 [Lottia gigantea]